MDAIITTLDNILQPLLLQELDIQYHLKIYGAWYMVIAK